VAVVDGVLFREGNISAQFLYRQEGKLSKILEEGYMGRQTV
jgi:hypothetical protein